jgi:hypothetical protein
MKKSVGDKHDFSHWKFIVICRKAVFTIILNVGAIILARLMLPEEYGL